jgi:predicted TPR repeat methyltransferase
MMKTGRNDPCPCGSGNKYKQCCLAKRVELTGQAVDAQVRQAIQQAFEHHNAGRLAEAERLYRQILQINPYHVDALHFLGVLAYGAGQHEMAVELIDRAIQINPNDPVCYINLGNALKAPGNLEGAMQNYLRAISLNADSPEAHFNLAVTLVAAGRLEEAVAEYRRVLELRPDYAEAYGLLGAVLVIQGEHEAAQECYRQQVALDSENLTAQHLLASLSGVTTESAPADYVERLFDHYADGFDAHLQQLHYETPEKLLGLIVRHALPGDKKWRVLDLGCGTGLVGAAIAPFARQMVGVDLSAGMLERARALNLYQRLEHQDLLMMMRGEPSSSYDVIIAADVLIYLGRIDEMMIEAKRLLVPGGVFAFSIEAIDSGIAAQLGKDKQLGYRLEKSGRYSHSIDYIDNLLSSNGFEKMEMVATSLRMERGVPIEGYLIVLRNAVAK